MQPYLNKLPAALVHQFPGLAAAAAAAATTTALVGSTEAASAAASGLGDAYRRAAVSPLPPTRAPFTVDPATVERGLRGHAETQNQLAAALTAAGLDPRSPRPDEPNFDLAWQRNEVILVAEVKSTTVINEERQLRLGLGQVLRYRSLLKKKQGGEVRAVLVAEREPADSSWRSLCAELGVTFAVPGDFASLTS